MSSGETGRCGYYRKREVKDDQTFARCIAMGRIASLGVTLLPGLAHSRTLSIASSMYGCLRGCGTRCCFRARATRGVYRGVGTINLPRTRLLSLYSIIVTVNNSNSLVRTTHGTIGCGGPVLNIGTNGLTFVTNVRGGRLRLLGGLVRNGCAVSGQVVLSIAIGGNSYRGALSYYLGSMMVTENRRVGLIGLGIRYSKRRVGSCCTSNVVVSAPANSATCSLSTNNPIMSPGVRDVLLAPVYARSLFTESLVFNGSSILSIGVPRGASSGVEVSYSNSSSMRLEPKSYMEMNGSGCCTSFVEVGGRSFVSILGDGLTREETWIRGRGA